MQKFYKLYILNEANWERRQVHAFKVIDCNTYLIEKKEYNDIIEIITDYNDLCWPSLEIVEVEKDEMVDSVSLMSIELENVINKGNFIEIKIR